MVWMQRKLKCKVTTTDSRYRPEGIPERFIPVLGIETRRREKTFEGKITIVEDVYYLVVTNNGKLIPIASFNCVTMIDGQCDISINQAISSFMTMLEAWKDGELPKSSNKSGDSKGENKS